MTRISKTGNYDADIQPKPLNHKPQTLNPKPQTLNPEPMTSNHNEDIQPPQVVCNHQRRLHVRVILALFFFPPLAVPNGPGLLQEGSIFFAFVGGGVGGDVDPVYAECDEYSCSECCMCMCVGGEGGLCWMCVCVCACIHMHVCR